MGTSIENFKSQMKGIFRKNDEILIAYEKAAEYANKKGLQKYFQNKVKKKKFLPARYVEPCRISNWELLNLKAIQSVNYITAG